MVEVIVGVVSTAILTAEQFGEREFAGTVLILSAEMVEVLRQQKTDKSGIVNAWLLSWEGSMSGKKYPVTKDRRDIGRVDFAIEKMMAAREISSSCVGVEALLEIDAESIGKQMKKRGNKLRGGCG